MNKLSPKAVADRETGTILAIADIAAPAAAIFKAITTEEVEKWWGEDGVYHVKDWKADLKNGGSWTLSVQRPDGSKLPASGSFKLIAAPHKIVLTRRYDWDYPILGRRETTVTYLLDSGENFTRVTIKQEGFGEATQAAYDHAEGWERYLGWLVKYVER